MGVVGLWSLLEPVGKPISLEALENKVLAIDISIWLNQAVKGIRGESGESVSNAHVLGLFNRICKLLFYRIKPIFVFDGRPPQLKKDTLQRRRMRKSLASRQSDAARTKLISNYIRSRAVSQQLQSQSTKVAKVLERGTEGLSALLNERSAAKQQVADKDIFELPPLPGGAAQEDLDSSDSEREDVLGCMNIDCNTDIHQVDLADKRFVSMSTQQKAELLMELRDRRKQNSWAKIHEMPKEAGQFSGFQLERLKKRSAMHKCLDEVGSQATEESAALFLDHKLFVGDREGVKKEKRLLRGEIMGKDFVYMKASSARDDPQPGRSASNLNDDDSLDSEEEIELQLAQFIEMKEQNVKRHAIISLEDDDDIVVLEPSENCQQSARRGGTTTNRVIKLENVTSDDSSSSEEEEFVEVTVNPNQQAMNDCEKDLFADVFESAESHEMLESILSKHAKKAKEKTPPVVQSRPTGTEAGSSSSNTSQNVNADISLAMKKQNHLFLKIASRWVEDSSSSSQPSSQELPSTPPPPKKASAETDALVKQVQSDMDDLLAEMRGSENTARLIKAKNVTFDDGPTTKLGAPISDGEKKKPAVPHDEVHLLSELGVSVTESGAYESALLGEPARGEKDKETSAAAEHVTYAASAPGFVRSKRLQAAVEVEDAGEDSCGRDDNRLDEEIDRKLESNNNSAESLLNKQELMKIQEELAADQQQLVAERSRIDRQAATISDQMYKDCQELLQLFGLPWIVAPSEAEAECALLDVIGLSHGTITDDSDIWLFGGQTVYKNFFNQGKHCEQFRAEDVAKNFGLSREKMILLALMTGSDYTDGIESVGPVTAMEILSEFPGHGLEPLRDLRDWCSSAPKESLPKRRGFTKTREKLKKLKLPENFPNERIVDAYLNPEVDNSTEAFSWAVPNFVEITDFAHDTFGWSKQKIDEVIKPVIRKIKEKKGGQARIDSYFQKCQTGLLLQSSKRVQSAVDKFLGVHSTQSEAKKTAGQQKRKLPPSSNNAAPKEMPEQASSVRSQEPENSRLADERRKQEARKRAVEQYQKSKAAKVGRAVKRRKMGVAPARICLPQHNLSESDSD